MNDQNTPEENSLFEVLPPPLPLPAPPPDQQEAEEMARIQSVISSIYEDSDQGRAERFCDRFKNDVFYCPDLKRWFIFNNGWKMDNDNNDAITQLCIQLNREVFASIKATLDPENFKEKERELKNASRSGDDKKITPTIKLARSNNKIIRNFEEFDTDHYDLGCKNGVLNLHSGTFQPHSRQKIVTMQVNATYDPAKTCPAWDKFFAETFSDISLRNYVKRFIAYSFTGIINRKLFCFLYGAGDNGKTKLVEFLLKFSGSYGAKVPRHLTVKSTVEDTSRALGLIKGKRLLVGNETEEKEQINIFAIKAISGSDSVSGRKLGENAVDFKPVGKLMLFGNHRPAIPYTEKTVWKRLREFPCLNEVPVEAQNEDLEEVLLAESDGFLNRLLEYAQVLKAEGLKDIPELVRSANETYRIDQDRLLPFLELYENEEGAILPHSVFYEHYQSWAREAGIKYPISRHDLQKQVEARDWIRGKRTAEDKVVWAGKIRS